MRNHRPVKESKQAEHDSSIQVLTERKVITLKFVITISFQSTYWKSFFTKTHILNQLYTNQVFHTNNKNITTLVK